MSKIFRFAIIALILATFFNAIFFIVSGIYRSVHAYILVTQTGLDSKPGLHLVESIDSFLIALVFLILSIGITKLFVPDFLWMKGIDLHWMKIDNFTQLKMLLWGTVLLSLVVLSAINLIEAEGHYDWPMLVVPGAVVLMALAAKFQPH